MDVGRLAASLGRSLDVVPTVLGDRELYVRLFRDGPATDWQVCRVDDVVTGSGAPVAAAFTLPNGDLSYRLAAAEWAAPLAVEERHPKGFEWPDASGSDDDEDQD
jgi:hypothetical protein